MEKISPLPLQMAKKVLYVIDMRYIIHDTRICDQISEKMNF